MNTATNLKLILACALFAGFIVCIVATAAAKKHYKVADARFGMAATYDVSDVTRLMKENTPAALDRKAAGFVFPILFPIDLLLLACLGGAAALASLWFGDILRLSAYWIPVLVLVPALYMASDLTENCLLARLLQLPQSDAVTEGAVGAARMATAAKIWFLWLGAAQLVGLGLLAGYFRFRG